MILAITISFAIVGLHLAIKELVNHFTGLDIDQTYEDTHEVTEDLRIVKTWKTHLAKPLFYCVTCMASIWGTFFYILLAPIHYFGLSLVVWYVPTILAVALLNTWIFKLFNGTK